MGNGREGLGLGGRNGKLVSNGLYTVSHKAIYLRYF